VDKITHELILRREKLKIGWRRCCVFEYYSVRRCFKCWGFYYIAKNCTRQYTCYKCADIASDCIAASKICINCMHKIRMLNLKINDEHDALSEEYPTFKRTFEEEKKRTD